MRVAVTWPLNEVHNSFFVVARLIVKALAGHVVVTDLPGRADLQIHVGTPEPEQAWMYGERPERVIFYSFAEATAVPRSWVDVFNRSREVWVPSAFCAEVFARSGVEVPIRIVPLGIDVDVPPPPAAARDDRAPFTVLWQGVTTRRRSGASVVDGDRKRGLLVERAFRAASIPDGRLILKSVPLDSPRYDVRTGPVWDICEALSGRAMREIDDATDLFVWPTRGEAFGLLPLEKLARGIPCLVTGWSGVREYLDDFGGHAIEAFRLEPVTYNGVACQMADVDEAALAEAIAARWKDRARLRAERAALQARAVERWNFRRTMAPALLEALRRAA